MQTINPRATRYSIAVLSYLQNHNHSTNLQIVAGLREEFPALSKTTVHRITNRILEQKKIASAPPTANNTFRFDSNVLPHDHFHCRGCDQLKDIQVSRALIESVQTQLGACKIDGSIILSGICGRCNSHSRHG